ncbi:Asp23/Gls24 family envelope stress response protein [Lactobacillus mulieris]|uniref:Asp23/Gls24 family envelope stress response protein n=1 Tax=Lactobacillus mulieris TaxID=2508708 RepID=A0AAW5WVQ0_9LACO|nr:Asp23/Gls24 family envelope stress response protein [Lactobacillus mulieris]MCZ3621410.1 Asp23/Gls24 family envelope stress response protein [Lactobacillus mulieris]MCZ3623314.1 Asp23/Gls24 family envelope stress response protein [Lactobacillus mulieris]MCZ3635417.1 Asp23/Gls24 family envelope stress response protein [Lactobacillus mulieris]MCZ3689475.1 Asp23/Gls24 family envelope stress response protein [Lactobacillus mulieris]MCZ3695478.1 Asp23/Gls24 family envelope stress response protei
MADSSTILLTSNQTGDEIKIDLSVLEVILAIAAEKVDGVAAMRGSLKSGLNWVLGRQDRGKGVAVSVDQDHKIIADVYAYFDAGVNVPKVAAKIQEKLAGQLSQMTDLTLTTVNVHVVGLIFPDEKAHVTKVEEDKKELFPESEKDGE